MRLLVLLTPKISVKPEAYNPGAYNSVPMLVFFLRTNQNLCPNIESPMRESVAIVL